MAIKRYDICDLVAVADRVRVTKRKEMERRILLLEEERSTLIRDLEAMRATSNEMATAISSGTANVAADRARIAQAIREEMNFPSGIPDPASAILARLLRVVEGG